MDQIAEEAWRALSEQILTDVSEWRRSHPKATLGEIEDEIHARMSRLEAQVIQDTAQASSSRSWSAGHAQKRPPCPVCGTGLQARGKHQRHLQGPGGQSITLERDYGTCPTCGTGLFPPG